MSNYNVYAPYKKIDFSNPQIEKYIKPKGTFSYKNARYPNIFFNNSNNDYSKPLFIDSNITSIENQLNEQRIKQLKEYTDQFVRRLKETHFEYGYNTQLDLFVQEKLLLNSLATKEWLSSIFIENFSNAEITSGILRIISHLDYEQVEPEGVAMAISALSHKNIEVRENGIRTFENWGNRQSLKILKSLHIHESWLKDYVNQVILDIEAELK